MPSDHRLALLAMLSLACAPACSNSGAGGPGGTGGAISGTGGASQGRAPGSGGGMTIGSADGQGGTGTGGTSGISTTADAATAGEGGRPGTGGAAATGGSTGGGFGGALGSDGPAVRADGAPGLPSGGSGGGASGGARSGGSSGTSGGGTSGSAPYKGVANSPKDQLAALGAAWCYNWGSTPKATECADPMFVPMVWGKDNVASAVKAIGTAGYKVMLGFNEPNKSDQANMTVDEAIALWPTLTSNPDIRVSSPAVSDDGRAWLVSFMTQVKQKGLRVDFIAMHWYGWNAGSCTASQLEGAVNWASQWNLPVWVTEFGCMGSSNPDDQTLLGFFNDAIPMLKKHALVERYAWYPWNDHNHLYSTDAKPAMTDLGKAFTAAPQYR